MAQDKRKAAAQGDADAQLTLGRAYVLGEGVIEDLSEAYIWLSIAKANGDEAAASSISLDWDIILSRAEIRASKKEAALRMEAIKNRATNSAESPTFSTNIAIAATPKGANIAEARVRECVAVGGCHYQRR